MLFWQFVYRDHNLLSTEQPHANYTKEPIGNTMSIKALTRDYLTYSNNGQLPFHNFQ